MAERTASDQDLERWLERRPSQVAVAMAARIAARDAPHVVTALDGGFALGPRPFADLTLATLRANFLAWAAAKYETHAKELRAAAYAAAAAATRAADAAPTTVAATRVAAAAARTAATAATGTGPAGAAIAAIAADSAAGTAAAAARSDADAAVWAQVEADAQLFERAGVGALVDAPLWADAVPDWATEAWTRLKAALRPEDNWAPWIEWYEAVLAGRLPWQELDAAAREKLLVDICLIDELWAEGAATVNSEVERLIAEALPARIAAQGPGPHFALDARDLIEPAAHWEYDSEGNVPKRMRSLLPLTRRAAADLIAALPANDVYDLRRDAQSYLAAVEPEPERIDWGVVYGLGVFVENAAAAAEREIADRIVPEMEDPAKKALDTLRTLHLNLIMASGEGRALMEEADALRLTRDEQQALRADARVLAERLGDASDVATPAAAERLERAAEAMAKGPHAERGSQFGLAAIGNVSVVLVSAGTIAAFAHVAVDAAGTVPGDLAAGSAWLGYEALKKSTAFAAATSALSGKYDGLVKRSAKDVYDAIVRLAPFRDFVRANEPELRRIAEKSARMRWALRYIDFIVKTDG